MASAFEGMGVALPFTSAHPAVGDLRTNVVSGPGGSVVGGVAEVKLEDCDRTVAALFGMLRSGTRIRDLMTRKVSRRELAALHHATTDSPRRYPLELRERNHRSLRGWRQHQFGAALPRAGT